MSLAVALIGRGGTNPRLEPVLRAAGYEPMSWPAIALEPIDDAAIDLHDWLEPGAALVFVSPGLVEVLETGGTQWQQRVRGAVVASMGPGTTAVLEQRGITVAIEASPARAEGLLPMLLGTLAPEQPICILAGDRGRTWLADRLREAGRSVTQRAVYRNRAAADLGRPPGALRAAVYSSPSAADYMLEANPWLRQVPAVALGPTTGAWLRDVGDHDRVFEAETPDAPGVIAVLHRL